LGEGPKNQHHSIDITRVRAEKEETMKKLTMGIILIILLALSACSADQPLTVREVWARPGIAEGNSGVFFTISNPTSHADRLLSAESDIANAVELHKTTMTDGIMQMTPQEYVEIPAGEQVIFQPGDLHVMLIGLHDQLNVGDSFELTLSFEIAGQITLTATVQEP
jgi:copper(I)-binding protein